FWKTRYENSIDGSGTSYRTLVCYKETKTETGTAARLDPTGTWTGTWRDTTFSPPADGGRPENALQGTIFMVNRGPVDLGVPITVPYANSQVRLWRNTSIANLAPGQTATLSDMTLGYEWDMDRDNGSRPAGLIDLSSTTVSVPEMLMDFGNTYAPGTAVHSLTLYRAPSGALVSITGNATDAGGGVVGGVEVSVDGGATWHPATGRASWSYTWAPNGLGPVTIKARAIDDSGNIQGTPASVTVNVTGPISI